MAEGDPEVLPPTGSGGDEFRTQSIVINQFFQLVNKNNALPDGEALARYTPEDRVWIKEREQSNALHRQWCAAVMIALALVGASILLYLGVGVLALGLPAVLLLPGVAMGITSFINEKLKALSAGEKPNSPPQQ